MVIYRDGETIWVDPNDVLDTVAITLTLPQDIAREIAASSEGLARAALEAVALEGYRSGSLTEEQVRRMLNFDTRLDVHAFLKKYNVHLGRLDGRLRR